MKPWAILLAAANIAIAPTTAAADEAAPTATITLSMTGGVPISPLIYGINYNWNTVPAQRFSAWNAAMKNVARYTLIHYPGGWSPEHYDWTANQSPAWINGGTNKYGYNPATDKPGVDPNTLLDSAPQADFVTPSEPAIKDPANLGKVVATSVDVVRRYGGRVKIWDIGNEWWIQRGGLVLPAKRAENLTRYGALVSAVVPAMKAVNESIQIYATGDWEHPEEFVTMRRLAGPKAWAMLDGISIHTYCGMAAAPLCSSIPSVSEKLRAITGKEKILDSQWLVTQKNTPEDYGIKNANHLALAIQSIAFARMEAAIVWPVTDFVPALNFVSPDYATPYAPGVLFGWMSQYYEGQALETGGDIPAVAARNGKDVTVIVPTRNIGPRTVRIPLAGTGLSRVVSAEVMSSQNPDDWKRSREVQVHSLPVSIVQRADGPAATFTVNPGEPGRGSNWEIVRVTLQ